MTKTWLFWCRRVGALCLERTSARRGGVRHAPGASRRRWFQVSNAAGRHVTAGRVLWKDVGRLRHVLEAAAAVPGPAVGFAAGLGRQVLGDVLRRIGGGGARGRFVEKWSEGSKFTNWVPVVQQRVETLNTNEGKTENTWTQNEAESTEMPGGQLVVYLGSDCVAVDVTMFWTGL